MKKVCVLIMLLCILTSFSSALAWAPERTFATRDELPAAIIELLPQYLTLAQGYQHDRKVWLLMTNGQHYYPYFYYNFSYTQPRGEEYDQRTFALPLSKWQGITPVMTLDSPNTVTLHYVDRYAYSFHEESKISLGLCKVVIDGQTAYIGMNTLLIDDWFGNSPLRLYGTWQSMPSLLDLDDTQLPKIMNELIGKLDQSGWAVVNNPVPTDRLNLRKKASRQGEPIGRYYNGTPVQVVGKTGQWSKVIIGEVEGYMMTKFLTYDQISVQDAFPNRTLLPSAWQENAGIFTSFSDDPTAINRIPLMDDDFMQDIPLIIGYVSDDWFAVMTYSGDYGYMRSKHFTPE